MSEPPAWFKSRYSDSPAGECLVVAYTWRRSSPSGDFDACVEVAACPHTTHVRDSKPGDRSPRFAVPAHARTAFVTYAAREA